eukprot:COSAG01_NODE_4330_length_5126_cov_21.673494_7_plen_387_part_00
MQPRGCPGQMGWHAPWRVQEEPRETKEDGEKQGGTQNRGRHKLTKMVLARPRGWPGRGGESGVKQNRGRHTVTRMVPARPRGWPGRMVRPAPRRARETGRDGESGRTHGLSGSARWTVFCSVSARARTQRGGGPQVDSSGAFAPEFEASLRGIGSAGLVDDVIALASDDEGSDDDEGAPPDAQEPKREVDHWGECTPGSSTPANTDCGVTCEHFLWCAEAMREDGDAGPFQDSLLHARKKGQVIFAQIGGARDRDQQCWSFIWSRRTAPARFLYAVLESIVRGLGIRGLDMNTVTCKQLCFHVILCSGDSDVSTMIHCDTEPGMLARIARHFEMSRNKALARMLKCAPVGSVNPLRMPSQAQFDQLAKVLDIEHLGCWFGDQVAMG